MLIANDPIEKSASGAPKFLMKRKLCPLSTVKFEIKLYAAIKKGICIRRLKLDLRAIIG